MDRYADLSTHGLLLIHKKKGFKLNPFSIIYMIDAYALTPISSAIF